MTEISNTPLILLHGFAQTPQSWQTTIDHLPGGREIHAIELLGHGETALQSGEPSVDSVREHVLEEMADLAVEAAIVWGYSQGARVAMDLALHAHSHVSGLILESGIPGIENPVDRASRRSRDAAMAGRIESAPIEEFVELWEKVPALSGQSSEVIERQRPDRLSHDPQALAAALRGIGQAAYEPMWERLRVVEVPVLLITGERDAVYTAHADRMAGTLPDAIHVSIAHAGHAVHIAEPEAAAAAVERFLELRFS
ncbi:MAG: alpha/beta fold hydrolase [Solirubrobacterales bacterium]